MVTSRTGDRIISGMLCIGGVVGAWCSTNVNTGERIPAIDTLAGFLFMANAIWAIVYLRLAIKPVAWWTLSR